MFNFRLQTLCIVMAFVSHFLDNTRQQLLFLFFLPFLVFIHCVTFNLTGFDDVFIIEDVYNKTRDLPMTEEMVKQNANLAIGNFGDTFYRPVQFATYIIDSTISGKAPWMYHISNIIIHILTVLSLYAFLVQHYKKITAFIFSCIFAVHPIFASSVAWIPSRGDILLGLFGLLLFISFHLFLTTRKRSFFVFHTTVMLLLVFTKETAVLFPVLLFCYALFVMHYSWNLKTILPFALCWFGSIIIYFIVRRSVITVEKSEGMFGIHSFIKNIPAIPSILGNFFIPLKLAPLPLFNDTVIYIGSFCLLILLFWSIAKAIKRDFIPFFGLLWFILFTIPPMFYRLPNADYYFTYLEHRTYLPYIGLFFIMPVAIEKHLSTRLSYFILSLAVLIVCVFSIMAFVHSRNYRGNLIFFDAAIQAEPNNAMAILNKGIYYHSIGQQDKAVDYINHSIQIYKYPASFYHRGIVRLSMHDTATAERDFTVALMLDPSLALPYVERANIYMNQNNYSDALTDLDNSIIVDSTYSIAYYNRGNIYLALHQYQKALDNYSKAISLLPAFSNALINRGIIYYELHDYNSALSDYQQALPYAPENPFIYNNIGAVLRETKKYDEAIASYTKALTIDQNFAIAYYGRGLSYQRLGNLTNAYADWLKASQLGNTSAKETLKHFPTPLFH
jgi:protein O-mannosyl-transferase